MIKDYIKHVSHITAIIQTVKALTLGSMDTLPCFSIIFQLEIFVFVFLVFNNCIAINNNAVTMITFTYVLLLL